MELRDLTFADLPLYEALMTDPRTMAELGGPLPRAGLVHKVRSLVDGIRAGEHWYLTIVPDGEVRPVGTVCVWDHEDDDGQTISEIGWMVRPEFQGQGLATAAVAEVLRRARSEARWDAIHAFPGVTNGPSNAICRKNGFERLEDVSYTYQGRTLHGHHWRIDLRDRVSASGAGGSGSSPRRGRSRDRRPA